MYIQAGWALLLVLKHYLNQPEIYRNRAGFLLAGISLSLFSNAVFQVLHIGLSWNFDFTPLSFTFSVGVFYYSLYHFKHDGVEEKAKSLIIDQLSLGVVFFDLNDDIFYANKYFCDLVGRSFDKLLAKSIRTLPDHMIEAIQALEPNAEADCECVAFNRLVVFTLRKVVLEDRKGRFIGTIVFFTDVTDENRRIIQLEVEKMMAQYANP
jgi:PAS domain-containing protein